jgi:hypothetical protein
MIKKILFTSIIISVLSGCGTVEPDPTNTTRAQLPPDFKVGEYLALNTDVAATGIMNQVLIVNSEFVDSLNNIKSSELKPFLEGNPSYSDISTFTGLSESIVEIFYGSDKDADALTSKWVEVAFLDDIKKNDEEMFLADTNLQKWILSEIEKKDAKVIDSLFTKSTLSKVQKYLESSYNLIGMANEKAELEKFQKAPDEELVIEAYLNYGMVEGRPFRKCKDAEKGKVRADDDSDKSDNYYCLANDGKVYQIK